MNGSFLLRGQASAMVTLVFLFTAAVQTSAYPIPPVPLRELIDRSDVIGRAWVRIWPPHRFGTIDSLPVHSPDGPTALSPESPNMP